MFGKIIELTPSKFEEIVNQYPIAYLPVSPIEWHGEHLPFGTDAIRAEWVLNSVIEDIGGIMFPTEYCGTDGITKQEGEELWYLESIVGKKLNGNFMINEFHFTERIIRIIKNIRRNNFRLLVICTGHLSPQQLSSLENIENDMSDNDFRIILWHSEICKFPDELTTDEYLHAGVEETSEMKYINPNIVNLDLLGSNSIDRKLGLCDSLSHLISSEFGERRLMKEVETLTERIKNIWLEISWKD